MWIGFSLDQDFAQHQAFFDKKEEEINCKGTDGSQYVKFMELSAYGEPICINEYATQIAAPSSVHVLQLNDFQPENPYKIIEEHIDFDV